MHKYNKFFIFENLDTVQKISLGKFWGVDIVITSLVWLGPFLFFALHFVVNLLNLGLSLEQRLSQSLYFTIAVEITTAIHALGHIISGKIVKSPMDELLITALRDVNRYHGDQSRIKSTTHLGRALGGPVINIIVGVICIFLASSIPAGFWSNLNASLISVNLFFGLGGFLPLPSVDGAVIWREIKNLISKS
jgi:Zn-dependent protease